MPTLPIPTSRLAGISTPLSRLVQGCMMLNEGDLPRGFALLDAALALGVNVFDNAHVYGGGACERVLGAWQKARKIREQLVLITKGCHPYGSGPRVAPEFMQRDLEESLERLQTTSVDLWLFHRDDASVPVGPLVEQANRFIEEGKIGAYGASNWSVPRLIEARAYAEERALVPMVASSPNFSLAEQVEPPWGDCTTLSGPAHAADREWHERSGVAVFAWSSLASGFLSGRVRRANFDTEKANLPGHALRAYASEANLERVERLAKLAEQRGLGIPQLALAYVVNQSFECFPVAGAESTDELAANVEAVSQRLTDAELDYLELTRPDLPTR
jgi:aryl-alcohol dehydrogenase-like predicted oxidoreductase